MAKLVIEVPDDSPLIQDINSWENGVAYKLGVTQTAPMEFTLDTAEAAEPPEVENNEGDMPAESGAESPVEKLMASKRAAK